jgi:multicomponent Na+:H+ antiporter subunit B
MKALATGLVAFAAAVLFAGSAALPAFGDPQSPASTHVSPRYIEQALNETGAANMVTAVLADYRGYDTLGETAVIFTAGLARLLIIGAGAGWPGAGGRP